VNAHSRSLVVVNFAVMKSSNNQSAPAEFNVFEGPDSIKEFLYPESSLPTPLVELPDRLNPFHGNAIRIFAKLAFLSPLLNVKAFPALHMLRAAESNGQLQGVHTIVESSSGNTAFSLAVLASLFGIHRVKAFVPFDIAPGKLDMLRLAGVQPEMMRGAPGELSAIAEAREAGRNPGYFSPSQYENEVNPSIFESWFAPEIWKQTRGMLTIFAAGLGTTGTMLGSARFFRRCPRKVIMVAAICAPNEAVPGVRSRAKLEEIGFDWQDAVDSTMEVGAKESFRLSMGLCRSGLLGGPSSGFALAGLLKFLQIQKENSDLDRLRNDNGEIVATFVCGDTPIPYLDKYSTYLEASDF
jgi:cysteine synthase